MKLEAYILYHSSRIQVLYLQNHRRVRRNLAFCLRVLIDNTANHHVDDVVLGGILGNQGSHISAVTHDGYTVCNNLNLVHTV